MSRVLAVDLGGTKAALGRVDEDGRVHGRRRTAAPASLDDTVACIAEDAIGVDAVGVIVPGLCTPDGRAWCPNLWGDVHVPLRDALQSRLAVPVAIDCDRAGHVVGEAWRGTAQGVRDVAFVAVGTGIGVGIIAGGHVVRGAHGTAGSAGWSALCERWDDEFARCGCWEAHAAGPAIAKAFGAASAADVVAAAREGDARAIAALRDAAAWTGRGIATLVSVLDPALVVLGGGVMHGAGDLLLDPIREAIARWAQPIAARQCRVVLSTLGEDAGLFGAARLALDALEAS